MNMKKRILTVLLALALLLGALPAQGWAAPSRPADETAPIPSEPAGPEAEALFAGYVERTLCRGTDYDEDRLAAYGVTTLSGANLQIYNWLKEKSIQVANGKLSSSVFEFDVSGLNITLNNGTYYGLNTSAIMDALLADLPYELYWFHKAKGWSYSCSYNTSTGKVSKLTFKMHVYPDYAVHDETGKQYYIYQPDTARTGAATTAAKNAQTVVNNYSGLSDYNKLAAYRDYICTQVKYDYSAAEAGSDHAGGNPWQLIYVFDNNSGTNVVCEGYAKAFKYLCDLSVFSNDVACYTVSGKTTGPHMWNIVRINGQSYMADITACDTDRDNVKPLDALFLAGAPNGTANGYTINVPQYDVGGGYYVKAHDVSYTYEDGTKQLYPASILTLARSSYDPASSPSTPAPKFTDVASGAFYENAVNWAVANGVTTGTTATTFSPGKTCTHGEILTFLWRAAGEPSSSAQPPIPMNGSEFYYDAVRWGADLNVVGSNLDPNAPCTRLYAVFYIWEALGEQPPSIGNPFTDVAGNTLGTQSVLWALENGVTTGTTDTTFSPGKICSRGEIVTFLYRAYT